eukprot:2365361-Rhodomonas_salina.1
MDGWMDGWMDGSMKKGGRKGGSGRGRSTLQKNLAVGRKACSEKRSATSTPEFGSVPYLRHSSMYLSTDA